MQKSQKIPTGSVSYGLTVQKSQQTEKTTFSFIHFPYFSFLHAGSYFFFQLHLGGYIIPCYQKNIDPMTHL